MLPFFYISGFVNGTSFAILGLLVLLNDPKRKLNKLYFLLSLAVTFWAISYGIWLLSKDKETALFWARMLNFGSAFIPIFFCHWVFNLLEFEEEKRNKIILILGYLATLVFAISAFTPYYVNRVEPELFFPYWPKPGILYHFYLLLFWFGLLGYTFYCLWKAYKKSSGYKQIQLKYMLIGMILGFGGGATNYLLWYNFLPQIAPWGNSLVLAWAIIFPYAVLRYRFMDIRWILGRTGIYALSFLAVLLYTFCLFFINQKFGTVISPIIIGVFAVITAILLFLYLFRFFERIAAKYFYYTFYTLQTTLANLSKKLNQTIGLDKLTTLINQSLLDSLKLDKVGIILKDPEKKTLQPQQLVNLKEEEMSQILQKEQGFLPEYLQKQKKPLVREEIPFLIEEIKRKEEKSRSEREEKEQREERIKLSSLKEEMEKAGIALFLPLLVEEELMGIIILGNKLSQEAYTVQDLDLLTTLTSQTAVAFNNALSYSEIEKRKADLEKFYKLTVGRELRMIELKKEIERLKKEKEKL